MLISCEKCSASYNLDERMLSPSGTPVQCTRCNQVFLARPGSSVGISVPLPPPLKAAQAPIPSHPLPPSALEPSRVTQIYGRAAPLRASPSATAASRALSPVDVPLTPVSTPLPKGQEATASMKVPRDRAMTVELPRLAESVDDTPLERLGTATLPSMARLQSRRAISAGLFFGVGAAAILAAGGGLYLLRRRAKLPSGELERLKKAWSLLRVDDAGSRAEARKILEGLNASHPEFPRARFDLLSLVAVDWDEAKWEGARIREQSSRLAREILRLQESRSPVDWQVRANALDAELAELRIALEPLTVREKGLAAEAERLFRQLGVAAEQEETLSEQDAAALNRAQALYHAVRGEELAIALAHGYRSRKPPEGQDGWGEVALAEFALNSPAPGTARRRAIEELWAFRAKDSNFMRIQVLSGRLALQEGDLALAQTALEAVVALNPKHRFAAEVLAVAHEAAALEAEEPDR